MEQDLIDGTGKVIRNNLSKNRRYRRIESIYFSDNSNLFNLKICQKCRICYL